MFNILSQASIQKAEAPDSMAHGGLCGPGWLPEWAMESEAPASCMEA